MAVYAVLMVFKQGVSNDTIDEVSKVLQPLLMMYPKITVLDTTHPAGSKINWNFTLDIGE